MRNSLTSVNPSCKVVHDLQPAGPIASTAPRDLVPLQLLGITLPQDLPIVVGSLNDPGSLDSIIGQTQVVLSLAGPFALVGEPVVASCVRMGTHYCDSTGTAAQCAVSARHSANHAGAFTSNLQVRVTGEALWVKRMAQAYHEIAVKAGVRIVHCCAYDSIPADLGVLFVADHMARTHGK